MNKHCALYRQFALVVWMFVGFTGLGDAHSGIVDGYGCHRGTLIAGSWLPFVRSVVRFGCTSLAVLFEKLWMAIGVLHGRQRANVLRRAAFQDDEIRQIPGSDSSQLAGLVAD